MVDAGEEPIETAKREFTEEALDNVSADEMEQLWKKGVALYKGYVDDHRNTGNLWQLFYLKKQLFLDNSWMETVVFNFHDNEGVMEKCHLKVYYFDIDFGMLIN